MIHEVKSKQKRNGLKVAMKTYTGTQFKGPFISFLQEEYQDRIAITFGNTYAEDSMYADKTYLQLVLDALEEISSEKLDKPLELNVDGKFLKIPKDSKKDEIRRLVENFIIKDESFYADKYYDLKIKVAQNKKNNFGYKENVNIRTYADTEFKGPFLEYIETEYPSKVVLEFGKCYADDSRYLDKPYLKLLVDAIEKAEQNIAPTSSLEVKIGNREIEIPRDTDKFEIQELLIEDILKRTTFAQTPDKLSEIYDSKEGR